MFDLNGDGRAEVALKSGEGDPRDQDGRVQSGPEFLTILDGMSGQPITRIAWPDREIFADTGSPYNYASRNQLGIAFLDGKTPCLIAERGTYNTIIFVADLLGDWREELIVSTKGELRIHTTTIPATDRRPCLMTDPVYRIDVAHTAMGYTQVPMLSYDVASH